MVWSNNKHSLTANNNTLRKNLSENDESEKNHWSWFLNLSLYACRIFIY